jgi:hypothetical protein
MTQRGKGTATCRPTPKAASKRYRLVALALFVTLAACKHKMQISGVIDTIDYQIPSGQVITAIGDVTINASHKIEIDGVLYVAPGATVTFKAPSVNIPGTVQNLAMHVSWWRQSVFLLDRIPESIVARVDRVLGRTPRYWNRGTLDCFSPSGRAESLSTTAGKAAPSSPETAIDVQSNRGRP